VDPLGFTKGKGGFSPKDIAKAIVKQLGLGKQFAKDIAKDVGKLGKSALDAIIGAVVKTFSKSNGNAWGPAIIEILVPGYGNYTGPSRTDLSFKTIPADSMDELFRAHDIGW
jgi:hypothetical protein